MSTFSEEPGAGLAASLLGLIVIVISGVGFYLVIEKRMNSSSATLTLSRELIAGQQDLERLRLQHDHIKDRYERTLRERTKIATQLATLPDIDKILLQARRLNEELDSLNHTIGIIDREFIAYRRNYLLVAWNQAVGESLGDLTMPGGRIYRNAVIRSVDWDGIDIRHEDGGARIPARELEAQLRDRLRLDERPATNRIAHESSVVFEMKPPGGKVANSGMSRREVKSGDSLREAVRHPLRTEAEVLKLRDDVLRWQALVRQLSSEHAAAVANAGGRSGRRSAPGSLETWDARAARLGGELERARAELSSARAILRNISPNDPLTHSIHEERK